MFTKDNIIDNCHYRKQSNPTCCTKSITYSIISVSSLTVQKLGYICNPWDRSHGLMGRRGYVPGLMGAGVGHPPVTTTPPPRSPPLVRPEGGHLPSHHCPPVTPLVKSPPSQSRPPPPVRPGGGHPLVTTAPPPLWSPPPLVRPGHLPPVRPGPGNTVNERAVRILLECILVHFDSTVSSFEFLKQNLAVSTDDKNGQNGHIILHM